MIKLENLNNLETLDYLNQELKSYLKIFLIGYSCDIGAYNCESRTGQEQGPNCFREILKIIDFPQENAYFQTDFNKANFKVFDCGNVKPDGLNQEQAEKELRLLTQFIFEKVNDSIVLVMGGTDELCLPTLQSAAEQFNNIHLIRIDPQLDVKQRYTKSYPDLEPPVTHHLEHHQSHFRVICEDQKLLKGLDKVTFFGLQGHRVLQEEVDYLRSIDQDKFQYIYLERDIRRNQTLHDQYSDQDHTASKLLQNIISSQESQNLVINLDISAIKAQYSPGVSEPCPAYGFNLEEIEEIFRLIGKQQNIRLITISEYNPAIEKFKTGTVISRIYYNLMVGIAQRLNKL